MADEENGEKKEDEAKPEGEGEAKPDEEKKEEEKKDAAPADANADEAKPDEKKDDPKPNETKPGEEKKEEAKPEEKKTEPTSEATKPSVSPPSAATTPPAAIPPAATPPTATTPPALAAAASSPTYTPVIEYTKGPAPDNLKLDIKLKNATAKTTTTKSKTKSKAAVPSSPGQKVTVTQPSTKEAYPASPAGRVPLSQSAPKASSKEVQQLINSVMRLLSNTGATMINDEDFLNKRLGYVIMREKEIGTGTYAHFFKAKAKNGVEQGLKIIPMTQAVPLPYRDSLRNSSAKILRWLVDNPHPNIVPVYDIFLTSNKMYVFCQCLTFGNLENLVEKKNTNEAELKPLMKQITQAMLFLYQNGIAHRAIKTTHGMFGSADRKVVKLCGFGSAIIPYEYRSEVLKKQKKLTREEFMPYMAFEVIKEDHDPFLADVWSFGCMIIALLTKRYPFDLKVKKPDEHWKIHLKRFDVQPSKPLEDLITKTFVDPSRRLTITTLVQHPWLNG